VELSVGGACQTVVCNVVQSHGRAVWTSWWLYADDTKKWEANIDLSAGWGECCGRWPSRQRGRGRGAQAARHRGQRVSTNLDARRRALRIDGQVLRWAVVREGLVRWARGREVLTWCGRESVQCRFQSQDMPTHLLHNVHALATIACTQATHARPRRSCWTTGKRLLCTTRTSRVDTVAPPTLPSAPL
jgi:hypothetical protein